MPGSTTASRWERWPSTDSASSTTSPSGLTLTGAPASPFYTSSNSCGFGNPTALNVMMGLSVGWGDSYSASTNFQWVDITGLPNGKYRLTAKADPQHLVRESSYTNQGAWAKIRITTTGVTVLSYGPGA